MNDQAVATEVQPSSSEKRVPFGVALMQVTQPVYGSAKGTKYNTIEPTWGDDKQSFRDED